MTANLCFLGDSIAQGLASSDGCGARKSAMSWLYINNESHDFRCVGSQPSTGIAGQPYASIPLPHEGHSGYDTLQLHDLVTSGTLNYPQGKPSVVVLMAGSNDMDDGIDAAAIAVRLESLVDAVLAVDPALTMVLCQQICQSTYKDHQHTDNTARQQDLNELLPALAASKGGRVVLARTGLLDQDDVVGDADGSGVHPTDLGYLKMAYVIYHALAPWFGRSGRMRPVKHPWYPGPDPLKLL